MIAFRPRQPGVVPCERPLARLQSSGSEHRLLARCAPKLTSSRRCARSKCVRTPKAQMPSGDAPYTLLTAGTPNGWKPSVTLEELGVPYNVRSISLSKNEQKEDWFLKINPNGRIPALIDHTEGDLPIFESGAIMWYLATKDTEHKLFPKDLKKQAEVMSWLMFQMGGVGPMQGQANHFLRYAPEKIEYGINRYVNETNRLYKAMDDHLKDKEWLAAGQYTIADIANFTWVFIHGWSGVTLDDKPNLKAWFDRIAARPAVQRGLDVPEPNKFKGQQSEEETQKMIDDVRKFMGGTDKK